MIFELMTAGLFGSPAVLRIAEMTAEILVDSDGRTVIERIRGCCGREECCFEIPGIDTRPFMNGKYLAGKGQFQRPDHRRLIILLKSC